MVLSVAKFVPAGLHVYQTLDGKRNIKTQQLTVYMYILWSSSVTFCSWPVFPYILLFLAVQVLIILVLTNNIFSFLYLIKQFI